MKGFKLFLLIVLLLSIMIASILSNGLNSETIALAIKWTARTSFVLFMCTFIASPLLRLKKTKISSYLFSNRRVLGLSFFASHSFHLIMILILVEIKYNGQIESFRSIESLIPGFMVYIFIFLMAITSNSYFVKLLGHDLWKKLHIIGAYAISFGFLNGFASRISFEEPEYILFTLFVLSAYLLRFKYSKRSN